MFSGVLLLTIMMIVIIIMKEEESFIWDEYQTQVAKETC